MGGVEGGARRGPTVRMIDAVAEAWRERCSERRARAAPRAVPQARLDRSRLGAAGPARLDDFLRSRLAKYAARLPVTLEDLPIDVEIAGGEAVIRQKAPARGAAARCAAPAEPVLASALVALEGPYAGR